MYLSASYFSIFSEYVSILIFICLPVVVLSAGLATWLHFRQKKRKAAQDLISVELTSFSVSIPDKTSQSVTISPLAAEDKIGLIRECRKQLRKSRAKFLALKSDFTSTLKNIAGNSLHENDSTMKGLNEKITAYEKQIANLQNKLEVLETVVPVDAELQNKLAILELDNIELNKKINEQQDELAKNKQLLENIYKELEASAVNKTRGIAERSLP